MALIDRTAAGATAPPCADGQHYACNGRLPDAIVGCGCGCHIEQAHDPPAA